MMSKKRTKEEDMLLSNFLPSNLLSELDENMNLSTKNTHKESSVSNYFI